MQGHSREGVANEGKEHSKEGVVNGWEGHSKEGVVNGWEGLCCIGANFHDLIFMKMQS